MSSMFGIPSVWKREGGYGKHHWLFCMLENFGANVGLHGRMDQLLHNFYLATGQGKIKGWGYTMEGSENNPVMFELMSELPCVRRKLPRKNGSRNTVSQDTACMTRPSKTPGRYSPRASTTVRWATTSKVLTSYLLRPSFAHQLPSEELVEDAQLL